MDVTLYTTGCPRCKVLKQKLDDVGVRYETNEDVDEMLALGLTQVPVLCVNGDMLNYHTAMNWADTYKEELNEKQ